MKKFYSFLMMAIMFSMATMAQVAPKGQMLPFNGVQKSHKQAVLKAGTLVTLPESAQIVEGWTLTGSYINNQTPYTNSNTITVAYDGDDVYIQGLSFLCPEAWVKGTINGNTATFANGQYCGTYNDSEIYACGSADGSTLSDIVFQYDADSKTFTLTGYYLENTSATAISLFFYSYDIVISKDVTVPDVPTNVTVVPNIKTAEVTWEQTGEDATGWNLRYRPFTDMTNSDRFFDFEDQDQANEWTLVDNDGDGNNWEWVNSKITTVSGVAAMVSKSYENNVGALTPDNWMVSPKTILGGTFSFYACGQDADYAGEVFNVYVFEGDSWNAVNEFTALGNDVTATGEMTKYEYDLSQYSGVGYIAIRHYNITDMFYLNVDDVTITVPQVTGAKDAITPAEWTVVENVTSPYTIEGLTPKTKYELQVQSVGEEANSEWTPITEFTTLNESVGINDVNVKSVKSVKYYNLTGVESNVPFDGVNIVETTYTDGTKAAAKVIK